MQGPVDDKGYHNFLYEEGPKSNGFATFAAKASGGQAVHGFVQAGNGDIYYIYHLGMCCSVLLKTLVISHDKILVHQFQEIRAIYGYKWTRAIPLLVQGKTLLA